MWVTCEVAGIQGMFFAKWVAFRFHLIFWPVANVSCGLPSVGSHVAFQLAVLPGSDRQTESEYTCLFRSKGRKYTKAPGQSIRNALQVDKNQFSGLATSELVAYRMPKNNYFASSNPHPPHSRAYDRQTPLVCELISRTQTSVPLTKAKPLPNTNLTGD